jgi:hypothetical protein
MWAEWLRNPVSKVVRDIISQIRETQKELIAKSAYSGDELQRVIGECEGLYMAWSVEPEFTEEEQDAETARESTDS